MILLLAASVWFVVLVIACALRRANNAWRDVLAIGIIGAATAGFFWRLLFGNVWMPAGGGDLAQFLYPTYKFAAEWWRRGVIPLWNPYLFGGMPFVGDVQSGIFYPINLLTFLTSAPLAFRDMEFLSVLHFFIAGAGMYLFLRFGKLGIQNSKFVIRNSKFKPEERSTELRPFNYAQGEITNFEFRISISASLAGAIAFEFSDLFITHFGNLNLIAVTAWMPLVLLFYRRAVTDRRASFAAVAGVLLAVAFHAGHVQAFLFIVIALMLFAVYHAAGNQWDADERGQARINRFFLHVHPRSSASSFMLSFGILVLTASIALGLSAPTLLPSIEMTQHTLRAAFPYEQATQYSLPPAQLIGLLVPGFFGRGPQNAWGPWQRVEVGYIGVFPLVLALLALILRRDALTRFFGILALVGLALALGGYAILHGWLYQFAPGFGQLRAPARFIVLFDLAIAVLAAFGFDTLLHTLPRASEVAFKRIVRAAPWAFLLIALAAGGTAYTILILGQNQDAVLFARITNAANALVFFILLLALSLALILARATRFFRPRAWAALALALIFFDLFSLGAYTDISTDDPTRVFEHPDAVAYLKSDSDFYRVDARGTGVDNIWPPDTSILYDIFDVNGDNPLVLADFDRYWQSLGSRSTALYDLLNVKYLIGRKNVPLDRAKFRLVFDGDPALNIYENMHVRSVPRAFVVHDVRFVPDHAAALGAIHASDFDPAKTVVLEKPVNRGQSAVNSESSSAKIVGYGPNEILLEVSTASAGVLVLSEMFYPGWRAWVNDREVQVLRANYLFRAVELPVGTQRVRLLYDPMSFKVGVGLAIATTIVLLALSARWAWHTHGK